jgi:excisionase family DNA binding protein
MPRKKATRAQRGGRARQRWSTSLEPAPVELEVLTAEGAGNLLGVSARKVLELARKGKLPARKIGREWRFRRTALLNWLGKADQVPDWVADLVKAGKAEVIKKKSKR